MTHFTVKWHQKGLHYIVTIHSANQVGLNHASNGRLIFIENEFKSFLRCFQDKGQDKILVIPEDVENEP
jgi:hypothetical protein